MDDLAVDRIVEGGIGLVQPQHAGKLYDAMHSYLAGAGVTGGKVDVINTLEYVCAEHGGRVELAKAYYGGLSDSIAANFEGTGIIASMEQCNDFFFLGTRQVAMARAGDDFWLGNGDDAYWLQGVHMVNCSYNSLWMGQFVRPDWDMFQSDHVCAAFHAASRAVSGSPIYVSDSLGCHDFALLKTLVFPDGTLPLCLHYALPSSRTLSRIRRLSSRCGTSTRAILAEYQVKLIAEHGWFGGVIGAFNCQGAGWDPAERRIRGHAHCYKPVSGEFASLGVVDMLNCGGTIADVVVGADGAEVMVKVKGAGRLEVYSSTRPERCTVDGSEAAFEWGVGGKLEVAVSWNKDKEGVSEVVFSY
uniref:Galactinol--sucrose galactosyltransferase n=1 Tax=Aegilops tauschii TaxID=37682 RepID=N1R3L5_AEGTA